MAAAVYTLCTLTSLGCAVLLLRRYSQTRVELLLWSGLCFIGLALNSGMLVVDQLLLPQVDLLLWRKIPSVGGVLLLLYGLVMGTR